VGLYLIKLDLEAMALLYRIFEVNLDTIFKVYISTKEDLYGMPQSYYI
jgi:hypothetical protein